MRFTALLALAFGMFSGETSAQSRWSLEPTSISSSACEILLSKDSDYWSKRLDEAEVAIEKAVSKFSEEELHFIGKTISDNKNERKSTTCRWGTEQTVNKRLLNDTSINFGEDIRRYSDANLNDKSNALNDINFMRQVLGAHSCTDDFRYQALALRMGELYRRQVYEVDCPF